MLLFRTIAFTVLIPGTVAFLVPFLLHDTSREEISLGLFRYSGVLLILVGATLYGLSVLSFLREGGGTPAIWFARHLRAIIGEEPSTLVATGLYRRTRNPMYGAVCAMVAGEGLLFQDPLVLLYALVLALFFHLIVVLVEEPHLRKKHGIAYQQYLREVPRWFGRRRRTGIGKG